MTNVDGADAFLQECETKTEIHGTCDRDERETQVVWERCFQNHHDMFTARSEYAGASNAAFLSTSISEITLPHYLLVYRLFLASEPELHKSRN